MPVLAQAAFTVIFWTVCMYKFAVLAVSLPLHRPPPRDLRMRRFHVSDPQMIAKHVAESLAVVSVLGLWCFRRELSPAVFLPVALAAAGLALRLCARHPSLACATQLALEALRLALLPLSLLLAGLRLARRRPQCLLRWLHPLEAGPHLCVAATAVLLCLRCTSNVPVLVLWTLHICVLTAGTVERMVLQRLQWRPGVGWWYAVQLSGLSVYVANALCDFPEGLGAPRQAWLPVFAASSAWIAAVCAAAAAANWPRCVRQYRLWQRQHSVFTLATRPSGDLGPEGRS